MQIDSQVFANALQVFAWMPAGLPKPMVIRTDEIEFAEIIWKLSNGKELTLTVSPSGRVLAEFVTGSKWKRLEWQTGEPMPSKIVEYLQAG